MMTSSAPLWTAGDAATATDGAAHGDWAATGVSINTRTLSPGDLFIALKGPNMDGHDYITEAFEKSAAAACLSHRPDILDADAPLLVVADTQGALEALGMAARERALAARVIAVTGSVGKTGVKEALAHVLSTQGKVSASEGSLNNHWGLPLSLARMPADTDFAVLEMGMNHPGELKPLSAMARPHVCLITTIQPAHTEFFAGLDAIADAKAEIFSGAASTAAAVLNRDIAQFDRLKAAAEAAGIGRIISFGESPEADVHLVDCDLQSGGSMVIANVMGQRMAFELGVPGRHWAVNSLGVLAAAAAAGADVSRAAEALASLSAPQGRGERFEIALGDAAFTLIDESYNASPASMTATIQVLAAIAPGPGGRRIAVLGDMRELGTESEQRHRDIAGELEDAGIDLVYLAGEAMADLWDELPHEMRGRYQATSAVLAGDLMQALKPGDVVLVKGSAAANMCVVVAALKNAARKEVE